MEKKIQWNNECEEAINSILISEESNYQLPIYYLSKFFLQLEVHYLDIEKLILSLIIIFKKVETIFYAQNLQILANFPIKWVFK